MEKLYGTNVFNPDEILDTLIGEDSPREQHKDGKWYPARPLGYVSWRWRLRCALMVWRGEADILTWDFNNPSKRFPKARKGGERLTHKVLINL